MSSSENTICTKKLRWYLLLRRCQTKTPAVSKWSDGYRISHVGESVSSARKWSHKLSKKNRSVLRTLVVDHRKTFGIVIDRVLTINWCAVDRGKRHWILTNGKTLATSNITWQEILEGAKISKRRIFVLIIGCLSNKEARHHFPKLDRQSNVRRRRSKKRSGTSKARRSHWSLCQSFLKKCCLFIWNLK